MTIEQFIEEGYPDSKTFDNRYYNDKTPGVVVDIVGDQYQLCVLGGEVNNCFEAVVDSHDYFTSNCKSFSMTADGRSIHFSRDRDYRDDGIFCNTVDVFTDTLLDKFFPDRDSAIVFNWDSVTGRAKIRKYFGDFNYSTQEEVRLGRSTVTSYKIKGRAAYIDCYERRPLLNYQTSSFEDFKSLFQKKGSFWVCSEYSFLAIEEINNHDRLHFTYCDDWIDIKNDDKIYINDSGVHIIDSPSRFYNFNYDVVPNLIKRPGIKNILNRDVYESLEELRGLTGGI